MIFFCELGPSVGLGSAVSLPLKKKIEQPQKFVKKKEHKQKKLVNQSILHLLFTNTISLFTHTPTPPLVQII